MQILTNNKLLDEDLRHFLTVVVTRTHIIQHQFAHVCLMCCFLITYGQVVIYSDTNKLTTEINDHRASLSRLNKQLSTKQAVIDEVKKELTESKGLIAKQYSG